MNSHSSSGRLLAAIAIFVILTAVYSAPLMSPPARLAGLDANSEVIDQDEADAVPKEPSPESYLFTNSEGNWRILCCDTIIDKIKDSICYACHAMCYPSSLDARHFSKQLRSMCRCHVVAPCKHISYVRIEPGGENYSNGPDNYNKRTNESMEYGTFATSRGYQLVFMSLSIGSIVCIGLTFAAYIMHTRYCVHSNYVKHLSMSIAALVYVSAITESYRQPITLDFQSSGFYRLLILINANGWLLVINLDLYTMLKDMNDVDKFNNRNSKINKYFQLLILLVSTINLITSYHYIDIFHQVGEPVLSLIQNHRLLSLVRFIRINNLLSLLPGSINILINLYLSKTNKIQISSIHPELLDIYTFKMRTKYQMFKISVLMLAVDVVYSMDITMGWDFKVIHILHMIKASQGILVSYVLFIRPIVPPVFGNLFGCIRRARRTDEVTADPADSI